MRTSSHYSKFHDQRKHHVRMRFAKQIMAEQLSQSGYKVSVIADQRDNKDNEAKFDNVLKSCVYRVALRKSRYLMYLRRMWLCFKLSKSADYLICSGKFPLCKLCFTMTFQIKS